MARNTMTVADVRAMLSGRKQPDVKPAAAPPASESQPAGLAFLQEAGYDRMNVAEAVEYIGSLTETERRIVLEYEKRNRNRVGVMNAMDTNVQDEG